MRFATWALIAGLCAVGSDRVAVLGSGHGSLGAIEFAAAYPDLVSALMIVNGYARFTGPGGADLNRDLECNMNREPGAEKDRALVTHFEVIDRLKPAAYMNIHNWTSKFDDGLIGWDEEEVKVFESFMPALTGDYKRWRASMKCVPGNRSPGRYCRETYGTIGFVLEFPWYGRTAERMRDIGETALKALLHTDIELRRQREFAGPTPA